MYKRERDPQFEELLEYLRRNRGFNFTGYKRPSLTRRIDRRMQMVDVEGYESYRDYLEVHPDEFPQLFNTILINVTSFFRDQESWDYLAEEAIPEILEVKGPYDPVRAWSAGCATGEEAYSLAMLLAEAMGVDEYRHRGKVYATDVDEEGLLQARHASYTEKEVAGVPEGWLEKYFEQVGDRYVFNHDLRRTVVFGRHDLTQDAPISRLDLLVCRNTLIYLNAETQRRILTRFHFALEEHGYLFLGRAELLLTHAHLFRPTAAKHRIFTKVAHPGMDDPALFINPQRDEQIIEGWENHVHIRRVTFDAAPVAMIVMDRQGEIIQINARARELFNLLLEDVGRPLRDLEVSYRPVELRSLIEEAYDTGQPTRVRDAQHFRPQAPRRHLDVVVTPLYENGSALGVSITFLDVTRYHELNEEMQRTKEELETAYEELQSTNEELETTNEELQSSNEELQTTNEELQSTNEEMETMNEELQSTNEELQAINDELRERTLELDTSNTFLHSILASVNAGVVVVDRDLEILLWNEEATELWGLRSDEVRGRSLISLDIGLPVGKLAEPLREFLKADGGARELTVEATNRRGQPITCHISLNGLEMEEESLQGVVLMMEAEREA
jgi:two-component system CheB/CheR fusion protein